MRRRRLTRPGAGGPAGGIHVRPARPFDAGAVAALLRDLGASGPVPTGDLRAWIADPATLWHLAEAPDGALLGLQWVGPHPEPGTREVATFVAPGRHGLGVGSALWDATAAAARAAGHARIEASVREGNAGAQAFYRSRGFEPHGRVAGMVVLRFPLRR